MSPTISDMDALPAGSVVVWRLFGRSDDYGCAMKRRDGEWNAPAFDFTVSSKWVLSNQPHLIIDPFSAEAAFRELRDKVGLLTAEKVALQAQIDAVRGLADEWAATQQVWQTVAADDLYAVLDGGDPQ